MAKESQVEMKIEGHTPIRGMMICSYASTRLGHPCKRVCPRPIAYRHGIGALDASESMNISRWLRTAPRMLAGIAATNPTTLGRIISDWVNFRVVKYSCVVITDPRPEEANAETNTHGTTPVHADQNPITLLSSRRLPASQTQRR